MKLSSVYMLGLAASATAMPSAQPRYVVHEKRDGAAKSKFVRRDAVPSNGSIQVRMALKQRNLENGMEYLMDVSDPDSPNYGKHYTAEQVVDLFKPADESVAAVKRWLAQSGIAHDSLVVPKSQGSVYFSTTIDKLEDLLQTKYHVYRHARSDDVEHIGTDEYSLPHDISDVVDFVVPGTAMLRKRTEGGEKKISARRRAVEKATAAAPPSWTDKQGNRKKCSEVVTPECIRAMYNVPRGTLAHPSNKMGIYESENQKYAQADLDDFFTLVAPEIPNGTHPVINIIGHDRAEGTREEAGAESTLDFQMAYPLIWPQQIVDFQTEYDEAHPHNYFDFFLDAIDGSYCEYEGGDDPEVDGVPSVRQCGVFERTNVISISYGFPEKDYPLKYQKRQCDEFMKLGLQGTSLFLASGDRGVAEEGCLGENGDVFTADQASSCPYMTSVGSTSIIPGGEAGDEEMVTKWFPPGGGFSNIFPRPEYQKHAVNRYFESHDPGYANYSTTDLKIPYETGGLYNGAGRGYPDIAAAGDFGLVVYQGKFRYEGGTSMSAPIVGALVNLINEERIKAGKGPVGFVNPTLYKHEEMFHDVVKGGMYTGGGVCNGKGFNATRGWDPTTGMGTPRFDKMMEVFMSLA
ncbi:Peptidase S8/S53, subtilisin/kexin/sedolisin [Cordyceps fumosorosea ARSEF 2679]|uniref:Peptidase S8/S53, subtilisin/kexin/sedolisin n=1 Tax=Cordyceps fumosorosea (strain ARSEF 2679) TaxID=1081104 RepID=A0A167P900_CORFA|nr:Peptidase S8/S53, subtilisin/kexin/sedolisin [Cordyceps fumosorosea ARSEF 2679]OAA56409.1 Peptidase S8/S53, subtilisin/kexin/sedolisin [Cordyceps fumosorosea ARSEF 2679]